MRRFFWMMGLAFLAALGCIETPDDPPQPCPAVILPAIEVKVVDASTADLLSGIARGYVQDGDYIDTLRVYTMSGDSQIVTLSAANGREGTYGIHLECQGYQPWDTTGVAVARGRCGNDKVLLTVGLEQGAQGLKVK